MHLQSFCCIGTLLLLILTVLRLDAPYNSFAGLKGHFCEDRNDSLAALDLSLLWWLGCEYFSRVIESSCTLTYRYLYSLLLIRFQPQHFRWFSLCYRDHNLASISLIKTQPSGLFFLSNMIFLLYPSWLLSHKSSFEWNLNYLNLRIQKALIKICLLILLLQLQKSRKGFGIISKVKICNKL